MISLSEHLERIKKVMLLQGANDLQVLYFQLYLLCLGYDGLLEFIDSGIKDPKDIEPYKTLEKHFSNLWDMATEQQEHEGAGYLKQFLEDANIVLVPEPAHFLVAFNELLSREARHGGYRFDHMQPEELSELVYCLSGYEKGMTVYNPYAGLGTYASAFQVGDDYHGEEIDEITWGIGVLKMHMDGCPSTNYIIGDSLKDNWGKRFDIVVSTPPSGCYNYRIGNTYRRRPYYDILLDDVPRLLDDGGTCLIVYSSQAITALSARNLLESGMLDMVMVLPNSVMFNTGSLQVIVRMKQGRNPDDPVLMVDARDFYQPDGRRRKIVDTERILRAIREKDSRHVALVTTDEIKKNEGRLFPIFYLIKETTLEGLTYVPLTDLGTLFRPKPSTAVRKGPVPYVSVSDLSSSPTHRVTPSIKELRGNGRLIALTKPALLLARSSDSLKFGYIESCSQEHPVYLSEVLMAFIPNEELVTWEYVAAALSEVTLTDMGTSAFRLYFVDFAVTRIPKISKREQVLYVKRVLKKKSPRRENARESTRKVPVALVGIKGIRDKTGRLNVIRTFERVNDAKDWISAHSTSVEALIVSIGERVTESNVCSLCERFDNIPIFILTPDMARMEKLESAFNDNGVDYDLKERAYESCSDDDLVDSLLETVDFAMTDEGRIRMEYAMQLDDAESLDGMFKYDNVILRDELEELLVKLSNNKTDGIQNRLRIMRDNCLLQPLVDYGFLPNEFKGDGANIVLLADRIHLTENNSSIILNKQILPSSVAKMLRTASEAVLNPGSHDYGTEDVNTLMACINILMAALGELASMVDSGLFKDKDSPKGCFTKVYTDRFQSGRYEVKRLEDVKGHDYFYAGNVHLDKDQCDKSGIKAGDVVQINSIAYKFEERPKINDYVQVYFYTKFFTKVTSQDS